MATKESRLHALKHVKKAVEEGLKTVVVVSAMGRKGDPYATDTLLSLVGGSRTSLPKREQDLLMSCGEIISSVVFTDMLIENGISATSLTGYQAGFRTNNDYTNAKILDVDTKRILEEFKQHDVVVVAGFQGMAKNGDVTTIGRGGSDTTAAALGAALQAEWIDIFTDVEGVMTADPKLADKARPLSVVTYNEISNLAYQGAKVIHPRAVEIAMQGDVPIRIRSTYSDSKGTLVTKLSRMKRGTDVKERLVTGIAYVPNITQIKVSAKENHYDLQVDVFKAMANNQISVDFINISPNEVVYTVHDNVADQAEQALRAAGYAPRMEKNCAKVSVVGAGITGVPGVASRIVTALSERGIRILQSADSYTTIWVLVKKEDLKEAVNALHDAFQLDQEDRAVEAIDEKSKFINESGE